MRFLTSCRTLSLESVGRVARQVGSVTVSTASHMSSPNVSIRRSFSGSSSCEAAIPVKNVVRSSMEMAEDKRGRMIYVIGSVARELGVSSESDRVRVIIVCRLCFSLSQFANATSTCGLRVDTSGRRFDMVAELLPVDGRVAMVQGECRKEVNLGTVDCARVAVTK